MGPRDGLTGVGATLLHSGNIIHAFVGPQKKNPAMPLLANGVVTSTDNYVNDPTGFYVQVAIDVKGSVYEGFLP